MAVETHRFHSIQFQGKITFEEYQQKWNAIKPNGGFDNVPVKVNADQLQSYYDNGIITQTQYNQARMEMAAVGGKNVTVNVPLNQAPTSATGASGKRPPRNKAKTSATGASGSQPPRNKAKTSATGASGSQPPRNKAKTSATGASGSQPPRNKAKTSATGASGSQPPRNKAKTSAPGDGGNQPPQNPIENRILDAENIPDLRQRLTDLLNSIRQVIDSDDGRRWRNADIMQVFKIFQREYFHEMYEIVSELISNGHSVTIRDNYENLTYPLVISSDGLWREVIEYQVVDFLDVHDQLSDRESELPAPRGNRPPCPTVLSAEFQESENRIQELRLKTQENHGGRGNFIYGIRCRLCDPQGCPSNISYVGQTTRSVHKRVCGEHARAVEKAIKEYDSEEEEYDSEEEESDSEEEESDSEEEESDSEEEESDSEEEESDSEEEESDSEEEESDSEEEEYDSEEESLLPMYEHAVNHRTHVPRGTQPRNVFREVMDVIILPTGGQDVRTKEELRSWECFWQFFLHCRKFFWGWSHH